MATHYNCTNGHVSLADAQIAEMKADIEARQSRLREMQLKRNALLPVSQLPNEVLSKIFTEYHDLVTDEELEVEENSEEKKHRQCIAWVGILHVCSRWREVALGLSDCGPIWAIGLGQNDGQVNYNNQTALKLLSQTSRHEIIELAGTYKVLRQWFRALSSGPAPLLRELTVITTLSKDDRRLPRLPSTVFTGKAPQLESLRLFWCSVDWKWPVLSNLTTFAYHADELPPSVSPMTFFEGLNRMPNLPTLSLHFEDFPTFESLEDFHGTLRFPKLELLSVSGEARQCQDLLSRLSIPEYARRDMTFTIDGDDYFGLDMLVEEVFRKHWPPGSTAAQPRLQSLLVDCDNSEMSIFRVMAWKEIVQFGTESEPGAVPWIRISVHPDRSLLDEQDYDSLIAALPLRAVRVLHVGYLYLRFNEISASLPALEHLSLPKKTIACTFSDLSERDPAEQSSQEGLQPPPSLFPRLKTLTFHDVELRAERQCSARDGVVIFPKLVGLLQSRARRNARLMEVAFHGCGNVSEERLRLLRSIVPRVTSNGIEYETDEKCKDTRLCGVCHPTTAIARRRRM
ncbi:hypothetical protein CC1G_08147 [Coprinopsis cinerea okayama7|uniref:Uncharacterized protein n=1 Tax=Coprinopsis cinerea (strain Okayama-7 / 130 / ATCC MYA-4618 / FGSC 9003) TaxID=240176 RepID=A8NZ35_COPC7|nr:hypothetical protein CC1G_08147 [Coprinopsis cinerea okayama7\|eukprot:XP_001837593.2 hypothetical protein CC1G_08147 [Coprinopsis cinerea okayama7\